MSSGIYNVTAVRLSILSQIPSFFFVGCGEAFATVSGLEFFYSQAPPTMKSLIVALFYLCTALGKLFIACCCPGF
jgi:dipeptide/tripeptide permease